MALHIIKDAAFLKELPDRYGEYATVQSLQREGLKRFFGPRAGTVWVALPKGPAYPVLQVVVPEWKGGQGKEWEMLQRCYRNVLQLAAERRCKAIAIPLLAARNPDFPASIDYKIAVDTIRDYLKEQQLDVFLMVFRQNAVPAQRMRMEVERLLSQRDSEEQPHRSARPFAGGEDRFDTVDLNFPVPFDACEEKHASVSEDFLEAAILEWELAQESGSAGWAPAQKATFPTEISREEEWEDDVDSCCFEYDDEDEDIPTRKAPAPAPKKAVSRMAAPRKASASDRSTGSLPKIPPIELDAGFSETLLKLIDRSGKKDSEIYNKANVSRQHFSKIRNNPDYKPTKPTAIAFAIALELDMEETEDLIGRAGYRLTRSSKFDVIIMYFIQSRNYNMFDINETLYEFDQSLLGA